MGKITVLDENMINMIAAGEVVERPANVVKELLENSIDAGSTRILVEIEDGGKRLISIKDNGCGMEKDDLEKAFWPHATSKIKSCHDLESIQTMGFRGEALASIASIAQVSAISRETSSNEAYRIEFDCGKRISLGPASSACGTSIEVRNIFYRLPARLKFLRSANTEFTHICEQFIRVGLANCGLGLTLIHNGKEVYRLLENQGIKERIAALISRQIASELVETSSTEKNLEILAFMGLPASARATAEYQYTFLNGRYIRDKFITHAIKEAYRGLIEPGKSPVIFLFLKMPYEAYDVNVHPTKIEVRFDNSNLVHSQVLAVLREKLLTSNLDVPVRLPPVPATSFVPQTTAERTDRREKITAAINEFFRDNRPHHQAGFSYPQASPTESAQERIPTNPSEQVDTQNLTSQVPDERRSPYFQLHQSYIVAQVNEGFVIIDQHALHERIIYEELCRRVSAGTLESQRILIPESFEISEAQAQALADNSSLLERLGIKIEPFGPRAVAVQSFPLLLSQVTPHEFVKDLLDLLTDKNHGLDPERLLHEVLDMAACKAAIKAGQKLTNAEIEELIANKDIVERASRCPHGRPTTISFSLSELEKQFKRT